MADWDGKLLGVSEGMRVLIYGVISLNRFSHLEKDSDNSVVKNKCNSYADPSTVPST